VHQLVKAQIRVGLTPHPAVNTDRKQLFRLSRRLIRNYKDRDVSADYIAGG